MGLRGDYLVSYKDICFEEPGSGLIFGIYKNQIKEFNSFNLDGLLLLGLNFKNIYNLEFGYNPAITNIYIDHSLSIKDNCWEFRVGLNLNKILSKKA